MVSIIVLMTVGSKNVLCRCHINKYFFCALTYAVLKKLKEHFENTSDLNGENIRLDIYTDLDWVMC